MSSIVTWERSVPKASHPFAHAEALCSWRTQSSRCFLKLRPSCPVELRFMLIPKASPLEFKFCCIWSEQFVYGSFYLSSFKKIGKSQKLQDERIKPLQNSLLSHSFIILSLSIMSSCYTLGIFVFHRFQLRKVLTHIRTHREVTLKGHRLSLTFKRLILN